MAALQILSSVYSSLDRRCTTSSIAERTLVRQNGARGRFLSRSTPCVRASATKAQTEAQTIMRWQVFGVVGALVATLSLFDNSALAAKLPKAMLRFRTMPMVTSCPTLVAGRTAGNGFKGQDVAFKDVIKPLESVAKALVERVSASPTQKPQFVEAKESGDGKTFLTKASNYTRHGLGTVAIKDGKFYTLTTGANERQWNKMADKLKAVVDSFELST